ncbi:heavy-metal-associated domain-containing protein [Actinotalea ferrariae]|uniref:heavy-metal-associated domain-containing protein n=1 Tax=Actinotalea ferrariae TaxID=1386098 RepID=UPI001C8B3638|nr:heavy-metal-associated domain-containing protein [Actinotalea ferrariae]MBX9245847.1 heavy-metal-associated domain-containing protein [Actinotalea ferrariae]
MNAAGRLSAYGAGLVLVFGGAFAVATVVAPDDAAAAWQASTAQEHGGTSAATDALRGLGLAQDGFALSPVAAPGEVDQQGEISFQILDDTGGPLTAFATSHDKDLHLIVVRSDGSQYRHVHPELDRSTGTWSLPWVWDAPGSYRVFADFVPGDEEGTKVTLSRTLEVSGPFTPAQSHELVTTHTVDGFQVSIAGDLIAGSTAELTISIARDGEPVTTLQPYLGAFGHLVALREGDLGYLHVHAEGSEPQPGDVAGPSITFATQAPTSGRYLLYLDFQVDGQVHTAQFVLDAAPGDGTSDQMNDMDSNEH